MRDNKMPEPSSSYGLCDVMKQPAQMLQFLFIDITNHLGVFFSSVSNSQHFLFYYFYHLVLWRRLDSHTVL